MPCWKITRWKGHQLLADVDDTIPLNSVSLIYVRARTAVLDHTMKWPPLPHWHGVTGVGKLAGSSFANSWPNYNYGVWTSHRLAWISGKESKLCVFPDGLRKCVRQYDNEKRWGLPTSDFFPLLSAYNLDYSIRTKTKQQLFSWLWGTIENQASSFFFHISTPTYLKLEFNTGLLWWAPASLQTEALVLPTDLQQSLIAVSMQLVILGTLWDIWEK